MAFLTADFGRVLETISSIGKEKSKTENCVNWKQRPLFVFVVIRPFFVILSFITHAFYADFFFHSLNKSNFHVSKGYCV